MAENDRSIESIFSTERPARSGKSKLLSPDPQRIKYITEILHAFSTRKISFQQLTQLDPKKIKQVAEMGFVKLRHGRYDEARKCFEVLTLVDHRNSFHHLCLAGAYQKLRRYVDALFQYNEALSLDPNNMNAIVNRGEIYLRHKNYRKAAQDFREAILADTLGKDRYANRARSLVIAIKRSLARDKEKGPVLPKKKVVSPLELLGPVRMKTTKK